MEHLNEKAKEIILQSNEERVNFILSDFWIGYSRSKNVLAKLDDLVNHPRVSRMPSMLIVGRTNNGKTGLMRRFEKKYKPIVKPEGGIIAPVLYVQAPPTGDERAFYNRILQKTFSPYSKSDRLENKRDQTLEMFRKINLKVLIIDEIHNVLANPNPKKQRAFLNELRYISNEIEISLACSGTKEALLAIQIDPQMTNRFETIGLPRWDNNEEYLRLLASFEKIIPLKNASNLISPELSQKILLMSEGLIGEISKIIKSAALEVIKSGSERITIKTLNDLTWIAPSSRQREIDHAI
jgi:hypothetical protein